MAPDILTGILATGFAFFILGGFLLGFVELAGRIYGTYRCLVRKDLSSEQRLVYLLLIWFIPLGWLIYFLLGHDRTSELFSSTDFL